MKKLKVLIVMGTRPEVIKMAPIIHQLKNANRFFLTRVCFTGQHREMASETLSQFKIKPNIDLGLMTKNQELTTLTSNILLGIQNVLKIEKPDLIFVQGDTTTAMAASKACFYSKIPVAHIEAGLRTNNLSAPFPEELNRRIITLCSDIHFAPTKKAKLNLIKEGVNVKNIFVTGNTVIDALLWTLKNINKNKKINKELDEIINFDWKYDSFVLVTGHRRENFGKGIKEICRALVDLSRAYPSIKFVYSVHMNPNVKKIVYDLLSGFPNIFLVNPLGYRQFALLLNHCFFVLTDSGGIQEEAPSLGKPVLVMRDNTERQEGVLSGTAKLVSSKKKNIFEGVSNLIKDRKTYKKMSATKNPFGTGNAAKQIVKILKKRYILK